MWPGTPYLIREKSISLNNDTKNICLNEFKRIQCSRQNRIQAEYEMVSQNSKKRSMHYKIDHIQFFFQYVSKLKDDEIWYSKNKNNITPEKDADFLKQK